MIRSGIRTITVVIGVIALAPIAGAQDAAPPDETAAPTDAEQEATDTPPSDEPQPAWARSEQEPPPERPAVGSLASASSAAPTPNTASTPSSDPMLRGEPEFPDEEAEAPVRDPRHDRFLNGFRLGYLFVANADDAWDQQRPEAGSYSDHYELESVHHFVFGYEATWRMIGHEWLNVLLVGNILVAGVEQSRFFPSMNGLLGFEISNTFQIGVGVNLAPTKDRAAHMLMAAGWTPRVGGFYVPVHFFFIPDVYRHHRVGLTTGVSW